MTKPPPLPLLLVSSRSEAPAEWSQRGPDCSWICHRPRDSGFSTPWKAARGLLVETNGLELAELILLDQLLEHHPKMQVLLVVGDRGLAGIEALAWRPSVRTLAIPFTEEAARMSLANLCAGTLDSTSSSLGPPFWAGLVEGLRDPLASISGYLQLLAQPDSTTMEDLVPPALQAAKESEYLLQAIFFASQAPRPQPSLCQTEELAQHLLEQAEQVGRIVQKGSVAKGEVETDLRILTPALFSALLLLSRFGPEGEPELFLEVGEDHWEVGWQISGEQESSTETPPPFLATLLVLLAKQLHARVLGDLEAPHRVGLSFPRPTDQG